MSDTRDRNLDNKSPDELERDIEETRARISDEMGALGYKLGPEGLRDSAGDALQDTQDTVVSVTHQLKQGVIESSDSIGSRVTAFIKQNPLPATLFGIGLAWLLQQGQESNAKRGAARRGSYNRGDSEQGDGRQSSQVRTRPATGTSTTTSNTGTSSGTSGRSDETVVANMPGRTDGRGSSVKRYERNSSARTTSASESDTKSNTESDEAKAFRSHFDTHLAERGSFEEYEPAYRYGFDIASESDFEGKPWSDARNDVKRRWDDERNEPWYGVDEAIEHGYTTAQSRR